MKKRSIALFLLVLVIFAFLLAGLDRDYQAQGRVHLEKTLRRTAAACYASRGFYPPSVGYMEDHFGLRYDSSRYFIHYDLFAENLMPDITVLEASP